MKPLAYLLMSSLLIFFRAAATAQELDCEVRINTEQLTSDAVDNLSDFVAQVKQYMTSTRWTKDDFEGDRIKCTFDIFLRGSPSSGRYVAQVFVGSQRKIWDLRTKKPTEQSTATVRIFDDSWEFSYTRGIPLVRNEYRFDPLASFLDFYVYLILGFDYDSYESMGGTPHLQKALNILNLSRSAGSPRGWEFPGSGTFSRTRFIDELNSEKFADFREAIHTYHAEGLDRLSKDRSAALAKVYEAIESIGKVKKRINQQSVVIKTFFDTKYLELCELFLNHPDETIYQKLSFIDPSHQKSYDEYRQKRK